MRIIALCALALLVVSGSLWATDYRIDWCCLGAGGGMVSASNGGINCTIGQTAAGFVQNSNALHWIGFWAGGFEDPVPISQISDVKLLEDGVYVSISGKVATTAATDYSSFFYIEDRNRGSGIRVTVPAAVTGLIRGNVVNVIGTLATLASGERHIVGPMVIIIKTTRPLNPLGMINKYLGGGDLGNPAAGLGQCGVLDGCGLNNIGLLVKTWGEVTGFGRGYVMIDDGSGTPVRVNTTLLATPPGVGEYVTLIGVSSLHAPGPTRLLLALP